MKYALFVLLVASAALAQDRRPPVPSPRVHEDKKVTFSIHAPKAAEITIRGDWMSAAEKLTKGEGDVWSITLGPLTPDYYSYAFTVDGVRTIDPRNAAIKQGISSLDSMFFVPGEESKFMDNQPVPHGQIRQVWYNSKTLGMQRRMHVYTPPGYDGSSEKYPVLYLLHGSGDDDCGWSTVGRAGFIVDNLLAANKAKPMLVVMPNGSLPRPANSALGEDGRPTPEARAMLAARFTNELMKEIVPLVEKDFRVIADKEHRAIAGLSMGGGHTLRTLTQHPDQFGYVAIWSAGIGNNAEEWTKSNEAFLAKSDQLNKDIKLLSISVGDKDFALNGSKALDEVFKKANIKHELLITGGGHTWINWRQYLRDLTPRLFTDGH